MDDGIKSAASPTIDGPTRDRAKRGKAPTLERVTLSAASAAKLQNWLAQIVGGPPSVRISKTDLVNWIIETQPAALSGPDLVRIQAQFFDELHFAEWALRELKSARLRGENTTLQALMERIKPAGRPVGRPKTRDSERPRRRAEPSLLAVEKSPDNSHVRHEKISLENDKNRTFPEKKVDFNESRK